MTKEQYALELAEIKKDNDKRLSDLYRNYALANSKIELGNMIESSGIRIQVDRIGVFMSIHGGPRCVYVGFVYTKEGKQRKDQRRETIYQNDSIKIL